MTKRKILFFLPEGIGGAERVGVTISKILMKDGRFDIKYIIIGSPNSPITDIIPKGKDIKFIPKNHTRWITMYKHIKAENPHIVFAPCRNISRDIIWATKIPRLKCKVIVRSDNPLKTMKLWQKILIRTSFRHADVVIAQQKEMQQEIINEYPVDKKRVVVLQNPIDYEDIEEKIQVLSPYDMSKDEKRFVWVGRVAESGTKGQDVLLKAFVQLRNKIKNAHLYFIGRYVEDGIYYHNLKQFITDNHIESFVHFIGYDSNPYRWVYYADCFVLPSRVEGLPNSLVEAMYLKKPVVATRCLPIIDRMIEDGTNGYKVEVEDTDNMAKAMYNALDLEGSLIYIPSSNNEITNLFI